MKLLSWFGGSHDRVRLLDQWLPIRRGLDLAAKRRGSARAVVRVRNKVGAEGK
jgi:hypothetical protein